MKIATPKLNSMVLFLFTFVFIFVRAFDDYTQIITRAVIPSFGLIAIFRGGFTNFFSNSQAKTYMLLFLWSLLTVFVVSDLDNYIRYTQLFVGIILIVIILESFLRHEVELILIFWGIIVGVIGVVIDAMISGDIAIRIFSVNNFERASGIADNPNTLGALLLLGAFSLCMVYLRGKTSTLIYFVLTIFLLIAVLQTASRSAFLGFLMVQVYVIYNTYKSWGGGLKFMVVLGALIMLGFGSNLLVDIYQNFMDNTLLGFRIQREYSGSDDIRSSLIWIGIGLILSNPIFGVGSGNFTNNNEYEMYSHNDLIEVFANLGVIGFIIYISLLMQTFKLFRGLSKTDLHLSWIGKYGVFFMFVFIVQGLFKPLYIDIFWMFMFFILVVAARKSMLYLKQ